MSGKSPITKLGYMCNECKKTFMRASEAYECATKHVRLVEEAACCADNREARRHLKILKEKIEQKMEKHKISWDELGKVTGRSTNTLYRFKNHNVLSLYTYIKLQEWYNSVE